MHLKKLIPIIAAIPMLAGLVAVPLAQAAGTPAFNNLSGDQEFLQGRNVTKNGAYMDPVQADANEQVDVAVYYHNTVVDTTAENTTIKINLPSNIGNQHIVKGTLSADNVTPVSGTIVAGQEVGLAELTINSSAATKVDFVPGSVRWYPDRMATNGDGANLPNGQNGDTIVSTGLNLGGIKGCFQYSGFVVFRVKLTGLATPTPTPTPGKAILEITKQVRKAGTTDQFLNKLTVNPGTNLEYRITVRNIDGQVAAHELKVQDVLPAGISYVGPATLKLSNGTTSQLNDTLVKDGLVVVPDLKGNDSLEITFIASTDKSLKNDACLVNKAVASSSTAKDSVQATAETCFLVPTQPTPTPTPTVKPVPSPYVPAPTPTPTLPRTGPEMGLVLSGGAVAIGSAAARYAALKKALKNKLRSLDIL